MNFKTREDLYDRIHGNGIHLLETGCVSGDPYLESGQPVPSDTRRGLALLIAL